jgi:nitroreductase
MPTPIKRAYRLASSLYSLSNSWLYDALRFARHSGTFKKERDASTKLAVITKSYHTIEKGLALPKPRPGFGKIANQDLCRKVQAAILSGIRDPEILHAIEAIAGYRDFNDEHGVQNPPWIAETIDLAASHSLVTRGAPTRLPMTYDAGAGNDSINFILSRHSVRHFADADVPDEVLREATRAGQSAPCVCNRQASNVYFIKSPTLKRQMLACQNGNRGFGETAPVLALVTVDLRNFLDASERYQAWIDGGLFSMNLLLGVHAQGYGACCLNWSALPGQDKAVRKLGVVPPHETVIMMIAIGALRENYKVARSERRLTDVVMKVL